MFVDFWWHLIFDDICLMTQDYLDIWWHLFEMTSCSGHLFVICLKSYFLYNIWLHLIVNMWWHLTLDEICLMHQDSSDNWWRLFEISLCSAHLLAVCLKSYFLKDIWLHLFIYIWWHLIFDNICLLDKTCYCPSLLILHRCIILSKNKPHISQNDY